MGQSPLRSGGNRFTLRDWPGVLGAIFAALCCAGTPFIVAGLAALGLGFLRRDAILWPLMVGSLLLALWGFHRDRRVHGRAGPFILAAVAAVTLTAGVIFVHGFPAMQMIWSAVAALLIATAWNIWSRTTRRSF